MMVITPQAISAALDSAPAWAKIALTVPQECLRDDARAEMAKHVYEALTGPVASDAGQLTLPFA